MFTFIRSYFRNIITPNNTPQPLKTAGHTHLYITMGITQACKRERITGQVIKFILLTPS